MDWRHHDFRTRKYLVARTESQDEKVESIERMKAWSVMCLGRHAWDSLGRGSHLEGLWNGTSVFLGIWEKRRGEQMTILRPKKKKTDEIDLM